MNLFKRATATVALVTLVSGIFSTGAYASSSTEIEAANALAAKGYIVDHSSDTAAYNLNQNVLRQEIAAVARGVAKLDKKTTCDNKFSDVSATKPNTWACFTVEALLDAGLIAANPTFRPEAQITKAEAIGMMIKASFPEYKFDATKGTTWQAQVVDFAVNKGVVASFTNYDTPATRGFVVESGNNAVVATEEVVSTCDEVSQLLGLCDAGTTAGTGTTTTGTGTTGTGIVVSGGDVEVSLNPESAVNGTQIPKNGTVRFAKVDFTAGNSDVSLSTVELVKAGLATIPTGTKVWFEKNGLRVSGKTSFTSDNNAIISFAPSYAIKAGSTESLDLYVEINTSAGSDLQFTSKAITSSASNVVWSFTTPVLRTADYSVATATITPNVSAQSYNASDVSVELGKFTIANTDTNPDTRDIKFQYITLTQSGTANLTNLSDIVLEKNGVVVSSDATVNGKMLSLTVNDIIKDGGSAIYTVKAKINNVELTTDTYNLYLKNKSDITLNESVTSFRANVSGTAPFIAAVYSVKWGDVKFERDTTVPLSKTVAPGTSDVVLLQGSITAKSAINLENFNLNYSTSTGANVSLNTVYLQIGSSTFTATAGTGTTWLLEFLGTSTVNGTVPVKVYVKLKDAATGTINIGTLNLTSVVGTKEYVNNQNTVTSAIGSISPVTITVWSSTLNLTRTDGLGLTNIANGSKGVTVYWARFSSTQGNEIALSNLSVTTTGTANSYTGSNTTLTLYVDGVAKSTKALETSSVNFDNFNVNVSTSKSVDIVIKADFSDITTSGTFNVSGITYVAVDNLTSVATLTPSVIGARFNVATAVGTVAAATGNDLVNKSLLLANSTSQKLVSFQVTATNDTIKLRDLVLTGTWLTNLTNIRLVNSTSSVLGTAQNITNTGASFANLDSASWASINDRNSSTYFVVADVNSNTDVTGISANVSLAGSQLISSNGSVISLTGSSITWASHDIAQNTFKVTNNTSTSKSLASNAMLFRVDAFGLNNVTLTNATFTTTLGAYSTAGYTGATLEVYTTDNQLVGSGVLNPTGTTSVTFSNLNTINKDTNSSFVVKILGLTLNASTNEAWTVNLTGLNVNTGVNVLNASSYPKNTETFPLTSVK